MPNETPSPSSRLMSIDALRGFDMFWIVGGEELIHALHKISHSGVVNTVAGQMDHKPWAGVAFYDLIFPLFVFIVGVSLVFSLSKTIEQSGRATAYRRVLWRGFLLYILGLIYYKGISNGVDHIRWLGVLQRIALSYLFAGLIFCTFRLRGIVVACVALLLGYWALMSFVPVREISLEKANLAKLMAASGTSDAMALFNATTNRAPGHFEEGMNLANHVDFQYLPGFKWDGAYDPEGLLSTLPAIATCLLGVFAGLLLKNKTVSDQKKVNLLIAGGIAGVLLGFLWGLQFPVIKKLWTSSYGLVAGGYSCLFLAVFYQVIEIWNWRKWAQPFVWIGMNPITIYLAHEFINFGSLARRVAGGPIEAGFGAYGDLMIAIVVMGMTFLLVNFLYRRRIFLRV